MWFLLILIICLRYFTRLNYKLYYTLVTPVKYISNYFKVLSQGCPTIQPGRMVACEHTLRTQSKVEVGNVYCSTHQRWLSSLRQQIRRIKFKSKESLKRGREEEFK